MDGTTSRELSSAPGWMPRCYPRSPGGSCPWTRRSPCAVPPCNVPDPRPVRDALIAATALVHRMTVVTRNVADFAPTGVPLLNPWE